MKEEKYIEEERMRHKTAMKKGGVTWERKDGRLKGKRAGATLKKVLELHFKKKKKAFLT